MDDSLVKESVCNNHVGSKIPGKGNVAIDDNAEIKTGEKRKAASGGLFLPRAARYKDKKGFRLYFELRKVDTREYYDSND